MPATDLAQQPQAQHMRALDLANRVRLARAQLKRQVCDSEITAAEVIIDCPWEAESMSISDLLLSQRRWGTTRCRKFLASIPMTETKTLGSMTDRQRQTLAAMLTAGGSAVERPRQATSLAYAAAQSAQA
ncbi:MAG: hypothetical protein WCK06_04855 [Actinomycetota bacterium]